MSKKLLLADDSVVIQKLVGLSFANEDIEITATDNGDDAVAMAAELRPDVVLADVVMPGKSGYEVCEAIKQNPALAQTPVLLLTGTFEAFDEARAEAAGADGQITKPFEAQALVERVTEVMRQGVTATPKSTGDASRPAETSGSPEAPRAAVSSASPPAFDEGATRFEPVAPATPGDSRSYDLFEKDVSSLSGPETLLEDEAIGLDETPSLSTDYDPGAFSIGGDEVDDHARTSFQSSESTASGLFGDSLAQASFDREPDPAANDDRPPAWQPDAAHAGRDGTETTETTEATPPPAWPTAGDAAPERTSRTADPMPSSTAAGLDPAAAADDLRADFGFGAGPAADELAGGMSDESLANAETQLAVGGAAPEDPTIHAAPGTSATGHDDAAGRSGPGMRDFDSIDSIESDFATPTPGLDRGRVADLDARLDDADDLDIGPSSLSTEDLDFAFDVSEQVAADAADSLAGPFEDPSRRTSDTSHAAELVSDYPGYDVSSSDLATSGSRADASTALIDPDQRESSTPAQEAEAPVASTHTPPPIPEPETLHEIPELPQAFDPAASSFTTRNAPSENDSFSGAHDTGERRWPESPPPIPAAPSTPDESASASGGFAASPSGSDSSSPDLFSGLETGSVYDEVEAEDSFSTRSSQAGLDPAELVDAREPDAPMPPSGASDWRDAEPMPTGSFDVAAPEDDGRRVADLSPLMEQRIAETLEKVAWEAFSDLSETVVKQVMGRIEQIAWEVIPEMAETLVREEIRKMKGEDD